MWQGGGHLKAEGRGSGETKLTNTWVLAFSLYKCENQCVILSQSAYGFVNKAQVDKQSQTELYLSPPTPSSRAAFYTVTWLVSISAQQSQSFGLTSLQLQRLFPDQPPPNAHM